VTNDFHTLRAVFISFLLTCVFLTATTTVWSFDPEFGKLLSPAIEVTQQTKTTIQLEWNLPEQSEETVLYALLALPGPIQNATQSITSFRWNISGATPAAGNQANFKEENPRRTEPRLEIRELGFLDGVRIASLQVRFYYSSSASNVISFPNGSVYLQFNQLDPAQFDSFPKDITPLADALLLNHPSQKITLDAQNHVAPYLDKRALKVITKKEGLYRLSAKTILEELQQEVDVSRLSLFHQSAPTERAVIDAKGQFKTDGLLDPNDDILFYAPASLSAFSTETVTWFALEKESVRQFAYPVMEETNQKVTTLPQTYHYEHDLDFIVGKPTNEQQDEYWIWDELISAATPEYSFSTRTQPMSATSSLQMQIHLEKGRPSDLVGSITPYLDGQIIDWTLSNDAGSAIASATLPADCLQTGVHKLTFAVTDSSRLQSRFEAIYFDWLDIAFSTEIQPSTVCYQTPNHPVRIDVKKDSYVLWLPGDHAASPRLAIDSGSITVPSNGRLFITNKKDARLPIRTERYDPNSEGVTGLKNLSQADVILISPSAWHSALTPFRESLLRLGYTTRTASIEAIYDRFGDGSLSPFAIREFLRSAYKSWKRPSPSYVLLIGDASWDYKNRYGVGVKNYVPGYRGKPEYAVENWFVRLDGDNDNIPDMMIGRWPLRTVEELETLIDKTVQYKESLKPEDWLNHLFLLTDHGFERFTEELEREWIPIGFRLTQRHVEDYPLVDNIYLPEKLRAEKRAKTSLAATRDIINHLNQGVWLMEFFGHGAPNVVGNERLFFGGGSKYTDVKKLKNKERPFLFWSFSCETSKFDYPRQKWNISIGEDMLTHPNGGAVGLLGASGRGYPHDHIILARGMHEALFHYGLRSMGQILLAGNLMGLAYQNVFEPADQFCFLGDPTIHLPMFEKLEIDAEQQNEQLSISLANPQAAALAKHAAAWVRSGSDVVRYATIAQLVQDINASFVFDAVEPFYAGAEVITTRGQEIVIAHGADEISQPEPPIIEASTGMLPDLIIDADSVRVTPSSPRSGETIFLEGIVRNQGNATAENIFVNGHQAPRGKKKVPFNVIVGRRGEQIDRLDPGDSTQVRLRWDPTGNSGPYDLEMKVDPFDQIDEESEENNFVEALVTVRRKADLLVEKDHFKLTPIDDGKRYQVSFSILNQGESAVDKFLVEMAYEVHGSNKRLSGFVPEVIQLDPGERYNAGGIRVPANIKYFELVIDPDELIDEETHENNTFHFNVN
jgi:hypothetical protein